MLKDRVVTLELKEQWDEKMRFALQEDYSKLLIRLQRLEEFLEVEYHHPDCNPVYRSKHAEFNNEVV